MQRSLAVAVGDAGLYLKLSGTIFIPFTDLELTDSTIYSRFIVMKLRNQEVKIALDEKWVDKMLEKGAF
jgi:hypothetical protein